MITLAWQAYPSPDERKEKYGLTFAMSGRGPSSVGQAEVGGETGQLGGLSYRPGEHRTVTDPAGRTTEAGTGRQES